MSPGDDTVGLMLPGDEGIPATNRQQVQHPFSWEAQCLGARLGPQGSPLSSLSSLFFLAKSPHAQCRQAPF